MINAGDSGKKGKNSIREGLIPLKGYRGLRIPGSDVGWEQIEHQRAKVMRP